MRLRPYKSYDAKKIISWIKDEEVFLKWGKVLKKCKMTKLTNKKMS